LNRSPSSAPAARPGAALLAALAVAAVAPASLAKIPPTGASAGLRGELSPDEFPVQPPPGPAQSSPGGARVQIGALPTPDLARKAYSNLARSFPADFASRSVQVEPVTQGSHTLYRAYVAGFDNEAGARALCRKLSASGHPCMVRPKG
jgi:hypothetical protein